MWPLAVCTLTALLLASATAFAAGPAFEPGEWQITSQMRMPGMQMHMTHTYTICLTRENMTPTSPQHQNDCKITDQHVSGSTVTWTAKCDSHGQPMTMQGSVTYHGETMEGTMTMNGGGTQITQHTAGKRLGPCRQ